MYDPSLGRWLNPDPIDYAAGNPNLYGFVENNPVNAVDPTGLASVYIDGKEWFNRQIAEGKFTGLQAPPSLKRTDILNALKADTAKFFSAPGDVVKYLALLLMREKIKAIIITIPSRDTGCGCEFFGGTDADGKVKPIQAEVQVKGEKSFEFTFDDTLGLTFLHKGLSIAKVGYTVSFKAVVDHVAKGPPATARVKLSATVSVNAGGIIKQEFEDVINFIMECGKSDVKLTPTVEEPKK